MVVEVINEYVSLALVFLLAFLSPLICNKLRMPIVVGETLLGMILALIFFSIHRFTDHQYLVFGPILKFLAQIGLIFSLFLAGLSIDFQRLGDRGKRPLMTAISGFVMTLGLAYVSMKMLGYSWTDAAFMAVLMSTTSIPMVLTTIRETEGLDKDLGQNILVIALVADIGCICLLAVFVMQHKLGAGPGTIGVAFIIPFLIYLFLMVYWIGGWTMWYHPDRVARFFHPKDTSEQGVRMALAIVFLFVALSVVFNIEAILGAFLGGMFISLMFREGALLEKKLFAVGYGFFIPIFFIYAGMRFDISQFQDAKSFLLVPLLLLIAIGIKVIPSLMFLKWHTPREVAGIGVLSSVRLVLILAVATVGIELGIVNELFYSSLVLMVVIICILTPTLFKYIITPAVETGPRKDSEGRTGKERARERNTVVRKEVRAKDGK